MLKKKSIGSAVVCALALAASGAAFATPVNVDGVMWDTSGGTALTIQALNFRESSVSNVGDVLTGYGQIGAINGNTSFCSGCDLTFTFQYTVSNINTSGTNPQVVFDNGSVNFFVDAANSFKVTDPTTASAGTPWLSLAGHTAPYSGFTAPGQLGQLYSTIVGPISAPQNGSSGFGLLDVMGGPAAPWVNTNAQFDGADFSLNSSFQNVPEGICSDGTCYPILGQGGLVGATATAVPEPGELGLLGLGLGFLGFFIWRRRKEADGHA